EAIENIDIIAMGGGRAPKLAVRQGNQQDLPSAGPLLKILRDLITKNKYRLIILDPLGKLHELNENSNEDMTRLLEMIEDEVIKEVEKIGTNCTVLISHHESKAGLTREMEADSAGVVGLRRLAHRFESHKLCRQ
ncbi:hypothetical protein VZ95_20165, partial [Elstera litoralis]